MSANRFGERFAVTTFGESHGVALGCVVDGCPAGVRFDEALLLDRLAKRRPGGELVSSRAEDDTPEILSGIFEGRTLGTPIAMIVRNRDARSQDYAALAPRAGHADDVWRDKFAHVDPRGGGRSSGRETVARVLAAAVAEMWLSEAHPELRVTCVPKTIGPFDASDPAVPDLLRRAKEEGQSWGGTAALRIEGCPRGLGEPVFRKLKADLAGAMLSVGAVSAVSFGEGFLAAAAEGTAFHRREDPSGGTYGGIRGGIATGETIAAEIAFKPTSSVLDVAKKGRHDPCIVPRGAPVLAAMAWLVLADLELFRRTNR